MAMGHWGAQATVRDCFNITELIRGAAGEVDAEAPLIALCGELYGRAVEAGLENEDMVAVYESAFKGGMREKSMLCWDDGLWRVIQSLSNGYVFDRNHCRKYALVAIICLVPCLTYRQYIHKFICLICGDWRG
ncbi:uncharacterized protein BDW43DRAFT_275775 [Aspergillus alliaceus]|uniref:uncharacterized protein n=1 Tax=Petromyces alliaceus TaxID=209559 RepID=UPI0012A4B74A|nr:uncharacterized protein BDW43DRAFT_275775 [Aspergillus alliaceus]KAB8233662.1 hypothetical protein BDW43DRAFT_275775 [Aspergillus alliaceus]